MSDDNTVPGTAQQPEGVSQVEQPVVEEIDLEPVPGTPTPEDEAETEEQRAERVSNAAKTLAEERERNRTAARKRIAEERDHYRDINNRLIEALMKRGEAPAAAPPPEPGPPKPEDFKGDYEAYVEARATYAAEKRAKEILEARMQEASEQLQRARGEHEERQVTAAHLDRVRTFAAKTPDFDDVVMRDDINIPDAATRAIKRARNSGELLYAIGREPQIANRLNELDPVSQVLYVGELSQWLASKTPQHSNAAPAGRTVGSKPAPSAELPEDTEAYMAVANKRFKR